MFDNMVQQQLQHCVLPNHTMALADLLLLTASLARVKSASELMRQGLYSIMLIRTSLFSY